MKWFSAVISAFLSFALVFQPVTAYAQYIPALNLPAPGSAVHPSPAYIPVLIKGLAVHPENPFQFDFIIDSGNSRLTTGEIKEESERLVRYFLASLTVPDGELWVNLSPYEESRIVPDELGRTDLGRDMLAQDYLLKQLAASMIDPEKELGRNFWSRVRKLAQARFGTTDIPMSTFNKVWVIPETATVFEKGSSAYVVESRLKILTEEDYQAKENHPGGAQDTPGVGLLASQIIKEIVIPEIEKEVNTGRNFAPLRQIYHSLILAKWYKETVTESLLSKVYINKNKIVGVDLDDATIKDKIYDQYVAAYKKGVFSYIKEEFDPASEESIPRKYFSGGLKWNFALNRTADAAMLSGRQVGNNFKLTVEAQAQESSRSDRAMTAGEFDRAQFLFELGQAVSNWDFLQRPLSSFTVDDIGILTKAYERHSQNVGEAIAELRTRGDLELVEQVLNAMAFERERSGEGVYGTEGWRKWAQYQQLLRDLQIELGGASDRAMISSMKRIRQGDHLVNTKEGWTGKVIDKDSDFITVRYVLSDAGRYKDSQFGSYTVETERVFAKATQPQIAEFTQQLQEIEKGRALFASNRDADVEAQRAYLEKEQRRVVTALQSALDANQGRGVNGFMQAGQALSALSELNDLRLSSPQDARQKLLWAKRRAGSLQKRIEARDQGEVSFYTSTIVERLMLAGIITDSTAKRRILSGWSAVGTDYTLLEYFSSQPGKRDLQFSLNTRGNLNQVVKEPALNQVLSSNSEILKKIPADELRSAVKAAYRNLGVIVNDLLDNADEYFERFREQDTPSDRAMQSHDVRPYLINMLQKVMDLDRFRFYPGGFATLDILPNVDKQNSIQDVFADDAVDLVLYFGDEFFIRQGKTGNDTPVIAAKNEFRLSNKDVVIFSVDEDPGARTDLAELNTIWIGAGPQATLRVMRQIDQALAAGESEVVVRGEGPDSQKQVTIDLQRLRDSGFLLTDVDGTVLDKRGDNFYVNDPVREVWSKLVVLIRMGIISGNSRVEQSARISQPLIDDGIDVSKLRLYVNGGGATRVDFDAQGTAAVRNLVGSLTAADISEVQKVIAEAAEANFGLTPDELEAWNEWFDFDGSFGRRPDYENVLFQMWHTMPAVVIDSVGAEQIINADPSNPLTLSLPFIENRDNVQLSIKLMPRQLDLSGASGDAAMLSRVERFIEKVENPYWRNMRGRLDKVAQYVELIDSEIIAKLKEPVSVFGGWSTETFQGNDGAAYDANFYHVRVVNNNYRGPGKGGIRYMTARNLMNDPHFAEALEELNTLNPTETQVRRFIETWIDQEAKALALGMSLKNAGMGLPLGGAKGTVFLGQLVKRDGFWQLLDYEAWPKLSDANKAKVARRHSLELAQRDLVGVNIDIPAPDMNTDGKFMAWYTDEYIKFIVRETNDIKDFDPVLYQKLKAILDNPSEYEDPVATPFLKAAAEYWQEAADTSGRAVPWLGSYTGKPVELGGALGRVEATGEGIGDIIRGLLGDDIKLTSFGVQGFGNVGMYLAMRLAREGAKVTHINDISGTFINQNGWSEETLRTLGTHVEKTKETVLQAIEAGVIKKEGIIAVTGDLEKQTNTVLSAKVDILVPAARENEINDKNASLIRAARVVEGGNGPVTPEAEAILTGRGIDVTPDTLANAAGVGISFLETEQVKDGRRLTKKEVALRRKNMMGTALVNVQDVKRRNNGITDRMAFDIYAIQNIAEAKKTSETREFRIDGETMKQLGRVYTNHFIGGLDRQQSSLPMIPAFIEQLSGKEAGQYIGVDFSGSNLRVMQVEFDGDKASIIRSREYEFTDRDKSGSAEDVFAKVAALIKKLDINSGQQYNLGLTFAFQVDQTGVNSGTVTSMSKGWTIRDMKTKDPIVLLKKALLGEGLANVEPVALLNDTVATHLTVPGATIGMILGTGFNFSIVMPDGSIVNTESGAFSGVSVLQTKFDHELLTEFAPARKHALEKMVSGAYLGELMRLKLSDMNRSKAFLPELHVVSLENRGVFPAQLISAIEAAPTLGDVKALLESQESLNIPEDRLSKHDLIVVRELAQAVSERAGRLLAAVLVSALRQVDPNFQKEHTIVVDGSVYSQHPKMAQYINDGIRVLIPTKADNIQFVTSTLGSAMGAARAAAAVSSAQSDDRAMTASPGGIDMNQINVGRQGPGVDIQFDERQMQNLMNGNFGGFRPVIINIVPIPSVLPILGLEPKREEDELQVSSLN